MRADYRLLKKRILEKSSEITDQALFASSTYADYQSRIAEGITRRYRTGVHVVMDWDERETAHVAYTNNITIHINAANTITSSFPTRLLKSLSLTGMTGHECGHMLFTDFTAAALYLQTLENGGFYPGKPTLSVSSHTSNYQELMEALGQKAACLTLAKLAAQLINIFEDVYIEARMCQEYPGSIRQGINLNNDRFAEQIPSIQKQMDDNYQGFSIIANLFIQYCKAGDINNVTGYQGEYLDAFHECLPFVTDCIYETDPLKRFQAANEILVVLWDYIKPLIQSAKESDRSGNFDQFSDELSQTLDQQIVNGPPLSQKKGRPKNKKKAKISDSTLQKGRDEVQEILQEETGRIALEKTSDSSVGSHPGISYHFDYAGSGYETAAKDIQNVLTKLAKSLAELEYEEDLSEELQKESHAIRYGNIHKGIHIHINRITQVPQHLIENYEAIAAPLLDISSRLQQSVKEILDKKRNGEKLNHLVYGRRLEPRNLYHNDGGYFSRTRLPGDPSELAVALLIDESGSMRSAARLPMANQTAIILYDFCRSLNIPITIYGHTEDDCDTVQLYSYAEYNSVDNQDRYRLMDMAPRSGNRDGAALRFVAEHLRKRPEELKLLILISDGQPAGTRYYGTDAEADLRAIKKEYHQKGIILFAAAIGSDKERIKRIYGDGFLDITDLNKLPKLLPQLITQYIT